MDEKHHSMEYLLMELLIENGPEAMLTIFTTARNMSMKVERVRFISAGRYERTEGHRAFASGHKMRNTDGIERSIQQRPKRRTRKIRIFPDVDSLMRLAPGLLIEIDGKWLTGIVYVTRQREND